MTLVQLTFERPLLLVLLFLAGCTSLKSSVPVHHHSVAPTAFCADAKLKRPANHHDWALTVADKMLSPDTTPITRRHLIAAVKARFNEDPSADNRLALAVVYAVSGQAQTSNRKALALLDKLDVGQLPYRPRLFARWLSEDVRYRASLEESNVKLGNRLGTVRQTLARERRKLQSIARIESTIGPQP